MTQFQDGLEEREFRIATDGDVHTLRPGTDAAYCGRDLENAPEIGYAFVDAIAKCIVCDEIYFATDTESLT